MALILEEKKDAAGSVMNLLVWLVLLVVLASGSYYLFFKNPELVPISPPPGFSETQAVASLTLDPEAVIRSLESRGFKSQITVPQSETRGRANPFLP